MDNGKESNWYYLMGLIAIIFLVNVVVVVLFYSPYPSAHKLIIEREGILDILEEEEDARETGTYVEPEDAKGRGVTPWEALKIPGVLVYGLSFFCVKFSVYALLLWLPTFLSSELDYNPHDIANLQTANEIGNLFGGFAIGYISDLCYSKRSPVGVFAVITSFLISLIFTICYG
jgi:sugar phosphate permease